MIELTSDLGGGKTTFVQGLVAGLGYEGVATSPTFTLTNVYQLDDKHRVQHYDLYRLSEGGVLADALSEDIGQPGVITIIEWAGAVQDILPSDRLKIRFEVMGENDRKLTFESGGPTSKRILMEMKA